MLSENGALMQLCAMALKNVYILKSTYPASNLINHLNSVGIISDVDLAKNKVCTPNHSTKRKIVSNNTYISAASNDFVQTFVYKRCQM